MSLYCGISVAVAFKKDAVILTSFGENGEQYVMRVRDQFFFKENLVFHVLTPTKDWWVNVIFAFASFQLTCFEQRTRCVVGLCDMIDPKKLMCQCLKCGGW